MGDVLVRQNLYALVAKNPAAAGNPVIERDFAIDPMEQLDFSDYNETESGRFNVAVSISNIVLAMGTVSLGKLLYIRVETDATLKITNSLAQSQAITLKAGKTSALHAEFTALSISNPSSTDILKGRYCVVGD